MRWKSDFFDKADYWFCSRFLNHRDSVIDRQICGQSLVRFVPSIDGDERNAVGGTGTQSTHYLFLKRIFSHVELKPDDVLMDVGCGKGRVLAFLIREKCPCRMVGIEHNPEVGKLAAEWTKRYPEAEVMIGDALTLDYDRYTVLTLARSFLLHTFIRFVEQVEKTVHHPILFVSWYDMVNRSYLEKRPGWEKQKQEVVGRIHGLRIARSPQSWSIWIYNPDKRRDQQTGNESGHL